MHGYVLDDHDEEGQFDAQSLGLILGTSNKSCGDVGAHNFEH